MKNFYHALSVAASLALLLICSAFYDQIEEFDIQLFDNSPTDFCSYSSNCTGDAIINFKVVDACLPEETVVTAQIDLFSDGEMDGEVPVQGTYPYYSITGTYGIGQHQFVLQAADGCGNVSSLNVSFQVVDCRVTAPECIPVLAIEYHLGDAYLNLFTTDFIAEGYISDDCSGLKGYSIHKEREVMTGGDIPSYPHPSISMSCCEAEGATRVVRLYAWDNAFNPYSVQPDGTVGGANYDYCVAVVLLTNYADCACEGEMLSLTGEIHTMNDQPMEGVNVSLGGIEPDAMTNSSGNYYFYGVPTGADVIITPQLEDNPKNGVTTFDLLLLSKHILGVQVLDDPYKLIAADINASGSITTADLIQLRKLILGIYTEFPSNTSWRFVADSYVFPNNNPFAAPFWEHIPLNNLNGLEGDLDFVGIKIGDLNGSAMIE